MDIKAVSSVLSNAELRHCLIYLFENLYFFVLHNKKHSYYYHCYYYKWKIIDTRAHKVNMCWIGKHWKKIKHTNDIKDITSFNNNSYRYYATSWQTCSVKIYNFASITYKIFSNFSNKSIVIYVFQTITDYKISVSNRLSFNSFFKFSM